MRQEASWTRNSGELPRLLYVGEVDVQAFCHGSLLLYRILDSYPRDRLRIMETSPSGSAVARRLPGVAYEHFPLPAGPVFYNRFARHYAGVLPALTQGLSRELRERLGALPWDMLLTVAHGYSWIPAFDLAQRLRRPAHLVVHDDWPRYSARSGLMQRGLEKIFSSRYRQAASRLCVSPHMEAAYRERYHATGSVLYPSRLPGSYTATTPVAKSSGELTRPVMAYAGTVASAGQARLLQMGADALAPLGGKLLAYGPLTSTGLEQMGVSAPNLEVRGLVPPSRMVQELQAAADVLYLPMSFESEDADTIHINFPSKLTDYTAAGLPIVVCAADHSSAAQWVRDFPGAALVITEPSAEALREPLARLCGDPALRQSLATAAITAGHHCFTPERATRIFHEALLAA